MKKPAQFWVKINTVVEHRPQWTTPGGIAQFAPGGNGAATYGTRVHSSTAQSLLTSPASFPAPHTAVLTSLAATGTHVMRVNGVQVAAETPPGVMTALNAGLMIGARDGAGLFAGMRLYGLLLIDHMLSGTELARAERWAAKQCGAIMG